MGKQNTYMLNLSIDELVTLTACLKTEIESMARLVARRDEVSRSTCSYCEQAIKEYTNIIDKIEALLP